MMLTKNFVLQPNINKTGVRLNFLEQDSIKRSLNMSFEDFEYFYARLVHDFNKFKTKNWVKKKK